MKARRQVATWGAAGIAASLVAGLGLTALSAPERVALLRELGLPLECPHGYVEEQEGTGETECVRAKHPESLTDMILRRDARVFPSNAAYAPIPDGAFREALVQKQEMSAPEQQAQVAGASGSWTPYGQGPLDNAEGWGGLAGRIDSFDYDPVNRRLFATFGTGGVWMSLDKGANWVSIGDGLPSQIVGSVGWSSAGGGTLILAGGDPSSGGNDYAGLGAYWSNDLGVTWHEAAGVPDGALGYKVAVDHGNPATVYLGLSKGLFRSTDAGRSYTRIDLPVGGGCDTKYDGECYLAHFVTDVAVKEPGGVEASPLNVPAGTVLAAVGYRAGQKRFTHDTTKMHSPGNGLYRSTTGAPGTFARVGVSAPSTNSAVGFTPQDRIGRISLGAAIGASQDHNYVYALVQDAVLFNAGFPYLDNPQGMLTPPASAPVPLTLVNGMYVSPDFGSTWIRMADTQELAYNPTNGSALNVLGNAQFYSVGVQGYYNIWVRPDPSVQVPGAGIPTRLMFGLEEPFATHTSAVPLNGIAQAGPSDFHVVGEYWATAFPTTTHPDQHAGIWIPDETSDPTGAVSTGVTVVIGNDGGAYRQHVAPGMEPLQTAWIPSNIGFNTLLPYSIAVANDGTVWYGLQDNGSGYIDGSDQSQHMVIGGDGFFVAVDPVNSSIAYEEYTYGVIRVTQNKGANWTTITPPGFTSSTTLFSTPFAMDPTDARHIVAVGPTVMERLNGPSGSWVQTFAFGTRATPGGNVQNIGSAVDVQGTAVYAGFCGACDVLNKQAIGFMRGLATNVSPVTGAPAAKGTTAGWHKPAMAGLPNRYVTDIEIDPADPRIVYVTLGGYYNRGWNPPGSYGDTNANLGTGHVFKSTDAGENFTDVTGNLPNAHATTVMLRNGQLIVGTDVGIFISSDTVGTTWAALGTGLPSVPVADLQLKPDDKSQLFVATFGRGVYRYEFPVVQNVEPFTFADRTGVAPAALVESDPVTLAGYTGTLPVSITGGEYSIDGGAFTGGDGFIAAGNVLRVRHLSAAEPDTTTESTVTVGTYSTTFKSTTGLADVTPEPFTFTERTNVPTNQFVTSEARTIAGVNAPAAVSVTNGQYSVDGGAYTTVAGTISNGQVLRVRHVSSTAPGGTVTTDVTVGTYSTTFKSTTTTDDRTPDAFGFATQTGVELATEIESNVIMLGGYNVPVSVVAGPNSQYRINGGAWTSASGTINPGDTLQTKHTSSSSNLTYTKTYLKVGGVTGYFTTRTK